MRLNLRPLALDSVPSMAHTIHASTMSADRKSVALAAAGNGRGSAVEFIVFWLIMAGVCALVAASKGRSGLAFFVYGFFLWPIALVHALVMARTSESGDKRAIAEGRLPCPHCAEFIRPGARICPFCKSELAPGMLGPNESPAGKRIAFVGKFPTGMRDRLERSAASCGARIMVPESESLDWLVVGAGAESQATVARTKGITVCSGPEFLAVCRARLAAEGFES